MVKKQNLFIMIASSLLILGSFAYLFIFAKNIYSYSRFIFDKYSLLAWIAVFFIAIFILMIALLLCKNSKVAKLIVLLPLTFFVWWSSMVCSTFIVTNFWRSEITDFEDFHGADTHLEKEVKIAGLSIADITQCDVERAEDFEYTYQARLLYSTFTLKGKFVYSKESYNAIKQAFLSDPEFTEVVYTDIDQGLHNMTGYFAFENKLPEYQTKTYVDEWETMIIEFDDSECCFYFHLVGEYET